MRLLSRAAIILLLSSVSAQGAAIAFPADAGFIDVRDFGAKGDGVTDDTQAINAALTAGGGDTGPAFWQDKIVYLPEGTYLISAPIAKRYADGRFASGTILIGQSREETIIRLRDHAPGYDDAAHPKAAIFTTAKLLDGSATGGGKDYEGKGEGNDAFMNFVENMTVDTGDNSGAVGIDYLANNVGAVRNVTVKGNGITGIALTRKWPGPALLENVSVQGFNVGIDADHTEYGVTFEHIHLQNQREIGMRNNHNMLAIHDLTITGAKQPVVNVSPDGLLVIDHATIVSSGEAISNQGYLNLRLVTVNGKDNSGVYQADARLPLASPSWSLAAKEPPEPASDPIETWVSAGPPDTGNDATAAIRRAFASGAGTIYFPHGKYLISENIAVPPSVHRIIGMNSTIHIYGERKPEFSREHGMLRVGEGKRPLVIEKLAFDNSYMGDQVAVEATGARPVLLRDVIGAGVTTLKRTATGGEAFLENTCCGTVSVAGEKGVWARQLNTEGPGTRIENSGAPLWVLGVKTEQDCTVLDNKNGARTQVLGGLLYITGTKADAAIPAFRNSDSQLLLSYVEESFSANATYAVHVIDDENGKETKVEADALPKRNVGRMAVQIVGGQ